MQKNCLGFGAAAIVAAFFGVCTNSADAANGEAYTWPGYRTDLDYDTKTILGGDIQPPTQFNNSCNGVTGKKAGKWWAFYWGQYRDSRITDVTIDSLLKKFDTDFEYLYNTMGWAPDAQAQEGKYSAVYYYGSGTCADTTYWETATPYKDTTGGWQTSVAGYTAVSASFYPVYSFNTSCPYSDRVSQMDAMIHEGIHSMTNGYPGAKDAHWFQEAGNTWIQQDMFSHRNAIYSGMGFLNASTLMAPFMPIECYSGWLIDGTFGGPGAQGVNQNQRNLLGGTQYSNIFPTFIGTWIGTGAVRWIYGNAYGNTTYLLETYGQDKGLGDAGVRRLITEFRARLALLDMKEWSSELRNLINRNFNQETYGEQLFWDNGTMANTWNMTPYQTMTQNGEYLVPDEATTPGWSGSNIIPLKVQSGASQVTVSFYKQGSLSTNQNMNYLLCYRATDGTPVYSEPITGDGSVTLKLDKAPSSTNGTQMVFAVVVNTEYKYSGNEDIRKNHYNYKIKLEEGLSGAGASTVAYHDNFKLDYDWASLPTTAVSSSSVSSSSSVVSSSSSYSSGIQSSSSNDIATTKEFSINVTLPIDDNYATASVNFDAAAAKSALGINDLSTATFFAVEPSGTENSNSTANAPGHWFDKSGNVVAYGESAYLFSEFNLSAGTANVGHYPNRVSDGEKFSFTQGFKVGNKKVLFHFNVTITNEKSSEQSESTTSLMYGIAGPAKHIGIMNRHGVLTVNYNLERNDNVKVALYSAYGALHEVGISGIESAGSHSKTIDLNKKGLPAGTYIVKVTTGSFIEARSVTFGN